jgi:para-nitrobenzyl esterase
MLTLSPRSLINLAVAAAVASCTTDHRGQTMCTGKCDGSGSDNDTIVTTDTGDVSGTRDGDAWAWRGIPYAAPPVGALRWRPPQPPTSWTGTRDGSVAGNVCLQPVTLPSTGIRGDEDCLYLNVWAPAAAQTAPLPVIVFAHGGDWLNGAGSWPLYDGAYLAAHGPAIVVTINYRLGALGFLAHPALRAEDPNSSTGNYGLLDQVAALAWVQRNAAAFGGDPSRVLFWGQSAGAWSALMHLASPIGRDLFTRAFSESGGTYAQPLASAESNGAAYAAQLGCDSASDVLACLRALPGASAKIAAPTTAWDPVIDGYVLTEPVFTTIAAGHQAHVPLIIGTTAAEYAGGAFDPQPPVSSIITAADYQAAIMQKFPGLAATILARYPVTAYPSPRAAYVAVLDDVYMLCPNRRVARAVAASQSAPVWRYVHAHIDSSGALAVKGASHAVDLPFWFHTFSAVLNFAPDPEELALSDQMVGYLARFADTGDPNLTGSPTWQRYDLTDPYLQLNDVIHSRSGLDAANCDYWDTP